MPLTQNELALYQFLNASRHHVVPLEVLMQEFKVSKKTMKSRISGLSTKLRNDPNATMIIGRSSAGYTLVGKPLGNS